MKKIHFSRQSIRRAIQAACLALFFAAVSSAQAQTATGDGNGNVTISGSGHNFVYLGTNPVLEAGGTLTISSGSAITNTNSGYIIDLSEAATITNEGTLSVRDASGVGDFAAAITSTGGAGATTINNLGTASAIIAGSGTTAAAIYADTTTGAISVSNLGMIYAQAHSVATGIDGIGASGVITIANAGSVSASASGNYVTATGISAATSGDIKISSPESAASSPMEPAISPTGSMPIRAAGTFGSTTPRPFPLRATTPRLELMRRLRDRLPLPTEALFRQFPRGMEAKAKSLRPDLAFMRRALGAWVTSASLTRGT